MIISSCPLRISLFGGSTDHPCFIDKYGYGSVISFTSNLKTYINLHEDIIGYNKHNQKYVINYSIREEVSNISEIKNDVVRVVLEHYKQLPINISLTSDIFSQGSGLASSSSYIISLIKALNFHKGIKMSDSDTCALAYSLELKFNPFCGMQDPYGCGIGGFKRINFQKNKKVNYEILPDELFNIYDVYVIFTGINRNSKTILNDIAKNIDKSYPLLSLVDDANRYLYDKKYDLFMECFSESWRVKKQTSDLITENESIKQIDSILEKNKFIKGHKLCGAGNGGFYLAFFEKNKFNLSLPATKIELNYNGVNGIII